MKYKTLFALLLTLSLACNKKDTPPQALLEEWPQFWIFTFDASSDKYTYLEVYANNMKRSQVDKTYSLQLLAEEKECEFKVNPSKTEDGDFCFTIQSNMNKKRWLFATNSSNQQEVHLMSGEGNSETEPPGDSDNYKFLIHKMPDVNGVKTVVIESVEKPGYYISSSFPGFNYSPTQVVLTQDGSIDAATKFQCR